MLISELYVTIITPGPVLGHIRVISLRLSPQVLTPQMFGQDPISSIRETQIRCCELGILH